MNEDTNDFWQSHSLKFLEMAFRTDRCEKLASPDGYGKKTGECGDTTEIYLKIGGDIIKSVSFCTNGCMNTSACANTVAFLAEGRSLAEAWEVTPEDVAGYLETLPENEFHCAVWAVDALRQALLNYNEIKRLPWKRMYQSRV